MSTVNYIMSYVNQQPQSAFLPLNIRFNYWSERVIGDVQRGRTEIVVIDSISPDFQCQIHTQSVANQHPALLCNYLQDFLSWCDHSLDYTSRLKLAQGIAGSLEQKLRFFPLREVTAEVEVIEQRRRDHRTAHSRIHRHQQQQRMMVDGDVLIMDGGNVVSRRRGAAYSWIHRHQQQRIMDGNVLIFDEGNVETRSGPMTGVSRSAMKKLMKEGRFYYDNGGEGEKVDEECSICCENYIKGIEAIKMPSCLHVFHQKCIVRWLKTKNSCPLCRKTV